MEQETVNKMEFLNGEISRIEEDIRIAREKGWETHELYKALNRRHEQCDEIRSVMRRTAGSQGTRDLSHPQVILGTFPTRRKSAEALQHTIPLSESKSSSKS